MEQRGRAREVTKVETKTNLKSAAIAFKVAEAPEELIRRRSCGLSASCSSQELFLSGC